MKQYRIPLDSPINQTFYDSGFGFYIEDYPVGLQGYIICDNNPNTLREVTAQRVIRYTNRFAFWTLSTVSSHPGEYLDIWVIETESEFGVLPTQTQYLNVTLFDTDVATETTQSQILSELQTNIAKETTLQSANTNTLEIKNILDVLSSNIAKDATLNSVNTNTLEIKNLLKPYVDYEVFTFTATAGSGSEQTFTLKLTSREIHVNVLQGKAKIRFASAGGSTDFFTPTSNVYKFKTTSLTVKEDNGTSDTIVEIVVFYDQVFTRSP